VGNDHTLALTTGDGWKLIVSYRHHRLELYHLLSDPEEVHNRVAEEPGVARRLYEQLDAAYRSATGRRLDASVVQADLEGPASGHPGRDEHQERQEGGPDASAPGT
jgi:hypothetical protein